MENKSTWFHRIITIAFFICIFNLVTSIAAIPFYAIRPESEFVATPLLGQGYHLFFQYKDGWFSSFRVQEFILHPSEIVKSVKYAMIATHIFKFIPMSLILVYGTKLAKDVSRDYLIEKQPFKDTHIKRINRLGVFLMAYALGSETLLMFVIKLKQGFSFINMYTYLSYEALLVAGLVILFARVFDHGLYLQEEYDMTL